MGYLWTICTPEFAVVVPCGLSLAGEELELSLSGYTKETSHLREFCRRKYIEAFEEGFLYVCPP